MKIFAIILTYNEEIHLGRCLDSIKDVVDEVLVVDCFSVDGTTDIAMKHGARILQRSWRNYADQFNWALTQLPSAKSDDWILRIDADEYLTPSLASEIHREISSSSDSLCGMYVPRRMKFMGGEIRFGGVFPVYVIRLFRFGFGHCENRWMDEHVIVEGDKRTLSGELIDDNCNSLTWWTDKHNKYSNREAVEILNSEFKFMNIESAAKITGGGRPGLKRWLKERVYWNLPSGVRALAYFCYRYFLMFGFLDGKCGAAFHILQGFWYRYLVDSKVAEVKLYMEKHRVSVVVAIDQVLDINVRGEVLNV